jgi:hypothetical protein
MVSFSMKREPGSDHCYSKKISKNILTTNSWEDNVDMSVVIISYVYYSWIITTY